MRVRHPIPGDPLCDVRSRLPFKEETSSIKQTYTTTEKDINAVYVKNLKQGIQYYLKLNEYNLLGMFVGNKNYELMNVFNNFQLPNSEINKWPTVMRLH